MAGPELLTALFFGALSAIATLTDLRCRRIPDWVIGIGLIVSVAISPRLPTAAAGGVLGYCAFWAVRRLSGGKLGMGDVKYSAYLGSAIGPAGWWSTVAIASLSGILFVELRARWFRLDRFDPLPFAPFLTAGGLLTQVLATILRHLPGGPW